MRKHTLDNRKIPCPNARFLGVHHKLCAKRNNFILCRIWEDGDIRLARVIGRIASVDSEGEDCVGYAAVLMLSHDAYTCYIQWIKPSNIIAIFDGPRKLPAFFFSSELPSNDEIMKRCENGSYHEFYIENSIPI